MAVGSGLEKRDHDDRFQALHIYVTLLILTTIPWGKYVFYPYFPNEGIKECTGS